MKISARSHPASSVRHWKRGERLLLLSPLFILLLVGGGMWLRRTMTLNLQSVAYLPDGNIVCAYRDTSVVVRDGQTGRTLRRLGTVRSANALAFALSPDGKSVAVQGPRSDQAVLLDTQTGEVQHTLFNGQGIWASKTTFSADGKLVAVNNLSSTCLFDAHTGQLVRSISDVGGEGVFALLDGKTSVAALNDMITANGPSKLGVRDVRTGAWLRLWKHDNTPVNSIVLSPDKRIAAVATYIPYGPSPSSIQEVRLHDTRSGQLLKTLGPQGWFCNLAFSPDGTRLAACLVNSADVYVWDVATGQKRFVVTHQASFNLNKSVELAWSPDGNTLLTGSANDVLCLWDGHTGQQKQFESRTA